MSQKKQPILSEKNRAFCFAVADFCKLHNISIRKLSGICEGHRHQFQSSTVAKFFKADVHDGLIEKVSPVLAAALIRFLDDKGFHASEIEAELQPIFNDIEEFKSMIANRCELSPEAIRFFQLSNDPFDVNRLPNQAEVFTTPELDAIVARVKDAILYQHFIAVVGDVGSGKTLLKMRVATELAQERQIKARLLYPEFFDMEQVSVGAIATYILQEFEQTVPRDKAARVMRIKRLLTELYTEGTRPAIILDECHRLNDKVISSLKNFWEMHNGLSSRLLGIVLFGQPAFVQSRLRDLKFKEIRQRVQIIEMPPIQEHAANYLAHRIQLAGGDIKQLFEPKAIEKLCQNATTPLALGNLANEVLMEAFENEEKRVSVSFKFFKKLRDTPQVLAMRKVG